MNPIFSETGQLVLMQRPTIVVEIGPPSQETAEGPPSVTLFARYDGMTGEVELATFDKTDFYLFPFSSPFYLRAKVTGPADSVKVILK